MKDLSLQCHIWALYVGLVGALSLQLWSYELGSTKDLSLQCHIWALYVGLVGALSLHLVVVLMWFVFFNVSRYLMEFGKSVVPVIYGESWRKNRPGLFTSG